MKDGETLGFDGRVISAAEGKRYEKALAGKTLSFPMIKTLRRASGRTDRHSRQDRSVCFPAIS